PVHAVDARASARGFPPDPVAAGARPAAPTRADPGVRAGGRARRAPGRGAEPRRSSGARARRPARPVLTFGEVVEDYAHQGPRSRRTSDTLAGRLIDRDRGRFVGREAELAMLERCLLDEPPASVVLIHGPGG